MHLKDEEVMWKMFESFLLFGVELRRWELYEACFMCKDLKHNDLSYKYWFSSNKHKQKHQSQKPFSTLVAFIPQSLLCKSEKESVQWWWEGPRGMEGNKVEGHLLLADRSERACRLPWTGRFHYLHPHHHWGLSLPAEGLSRNLTWGNPHLWPSLSLSSCFIASYDFQIGQRSSIFVLLESLPIFLLSCFILFMKLCFIFICFYPFLSSVE